MCLIEELRGKKEGQPFVADLEGTATYYEYDHVHGVTKVTEREGWIKYAFTPFGPLGYVEERRNNTARRQRSLDCNW